MNRGNCKDAKFDGIAGKGMVGFWIADWLDTVLSVILQDVECRCGRKNHDCNGKNRRDGVSRRQWVRINIIEDTIAVERVVVSLGAVLIR